MGIVNENWRDVAGYEGLYAVSDHGRIKNLRFGKNLNPNCLKHGYVVVHLCKDGVRKSHLVHRLVVAAFLGEPKGVVDHINGDRKDNRMANLRSCNQRDNLTYSNRVDYATKSSIYPGVSKHQGKFRSQISFRSQPLLLGMYETEQEAYAAYRGALAIVSHCG